MGRPKRARGFQKVMTPERLAKKAAASEHYLKKKAAAETEKKIRQEAALRAKRIDDRGFQAAFAVSTTEWPYRFAVSARDKEVRAAQKILKDLFALPEGNPRRLSIDSSLGHFNRAVMRHAEAEENLARYLADRPVSPSTASRLAKEAATTEEYASAVAAAAAAKLAATIPEDNVDDGPLFHDVAFGRDSDDGDSDDGDDEADNDGMLPPAKRSAALCCSVVDWLGGARENSWSLDRQAPCP